MAAQNQQRILNFNEVNLNSIEVSTPNQNKGGLGKSATITSRQFDDNKILFLISNLTLAYTVDQYTDKTGKRSGKYQLNVRLDKDENDKYRNPELVNFLESLDSRMREITKKNSADWKLTSNFCDKTDGMIKEHISDKTGVRYADTFPIQVMYDNNKKVFYSRFTVSDNGRQIPLELTEENISKELPYNTKCNVYVKLRKYWISGSKWGYTLELESGSFLRPARRAELPPPPAVEEIDEDIEETVVSTPIPTVTQQIDVSIEDDVEQLDELEMATTAMPTTVPKKKAPAKKTTK